MTSPNCSSPMSTNTGRRLTSRSSPMRKRRCRRSGPASTPTFAPCTYSVVRFRQIAQPIDTTKLSNWKDVFPALQTPPASVIDGNVVMTPLRLGQFRHRLPADMVEPDFQGRESQGIFSTMKYAGRVSNERQRSGGGDRRADAGLWAEEDLRDVGRGAGCDPPAAGKRSSRTPASCGRIRTEINQALASGEVVAAYAWNDTIKNLSTSQGSRPNTPNPRRHLHLASAA